MPCDNLRGGVWFDPLCACGPLLPVSRGLASLEMFLSKAKANFGFEEAVTFSVKQLFNNR